MAGDIVMRCRQLSKGQLPTMVIAQVRKKSVVTGSVDGQVLRRLAIDPRDAEALVALYEDHELEIRAAASRCFERDHELARKAVNSILAAIGRQAGSYDPRSMDASEWIQQCAEAEARRLREALDSGAAGSPGAARPS